MNRWGARAAPAIALVALALDARVRIATGRVLVREQTLPRFGAPAVASCCDLVQDEVEIALVTERKLEWLPWQLRREAGLSVRRGGAPDSGGRATALQLAAASGWVSPAALLGRFGQLRWVVPASIQWSWGTRNKYIRDDPLRPAVAREGVRRDVISSRYFYRVEGPGLGLGCGAELTLGDRWQLVALARLTWAQQQATRLSLLQETDLEHEDSWLRLHLCGAQARSLPRFRSVAAGLSFGVVVEW